MKEKYNQQTIAVIAAAMTVLATTLTGFVSFGYNGDMISRLFDKGW